MSTHRHQCGICGVVWEHPDSTILAEKEVFEKAHRCPEGCEGRWTVHYLDDDEEDAFFCTMRAKFRERLFGVRK
jgi:hypothetical protein